MTATVRDERVIALLQKENPLLARVLQRVSTESQNKKSTSFPRKKRTFRK